MDVNKFLKTHLIEILVLIIGVVSGYILMFSTFYKKNNTLFIATKAWSDFASHIPLIRSFSLGSNFPPQYPLFPGEPIKYHFIFYALAGLLEKIGLPIDLALNLPSFLGFLLLIFLIYYFAREIFKSKIVGLMSVIFFLFNSSLSFIYFFQKYPLSGNTIKQIVSNNNFVSFAPYASGIISAFWNLNIYTNQRHLAISFALSLALIYLLIKPVISRDRASPRIIFLLAILFGFSFFLHTAVFLMTLVIIFLLAIAFPKIRKECFLILFLGGFIAFPQYIYLKGSAGFSPKIVFGFLVSHQPTLYKFLQFWFYNFGLSLFLIPLGFLISTRIQKKILVVFFFLFLIGNSIQFSPEIAANHKFFNYFLIVGNMFSAYFLVKLWNKGKIIKPIVVILFFFMIFGGIIDIFPILNDGKVTIPDYEINQNALWIKNNTSPSSVFLNTTFLYDPASLAGRKIFMGWPYFAWSQGYNTDKRGQIMKTILGSATEQTACKLLIKDRIDYVEIKIQNPPDPNIPPISNIFRDEFKKSYENANDNYSIYKVLDNCDE